MKRIKDSNELPNEWFKDGKAYLLNEPNAYYDTLWKAVLWSGSGYNLAPFLFYAPSRFSEQTLEVLVAALEADGNDNFFVDDYYFNNPDIDTSEDADVDVYDLIDEYRDIYVDATMEGASEPHVLRGENLKIEPADEPIEYYVGEPVSDSRRVKDDEDEPDEYYFSVGIIGSESMSKSEGRKYEKELSELLTGKQYVGKGGLYCETGWVEPMDRVGEGESVAVWGYCNADSDETVQNTVEQWTDAWAQQNGFRLHISVDEQ